MLTENVRFIDGHNYRQHIGIENNESKKRVKYNS